MGNRSCESCTFSKRTTECIKGLNFIHNYANGNNCKDWSERVFTNADALRQMNDEELLAEILRLQDIAAACPSCHKKHGAERLWLYLTTKARTE